MTVKDRTQHVLEGGEDVCALPTFQLICRACAREVAASSLTELLKVEAWHHEDAYHRHDEVWWAKRLEERAEYVEGMGR